jgi:hypothetical protein
LLSHAFPRSPTLKYPQLISTRPMWATHWEKRRVHWAFCGDSNSLCFSRVAGKHR